MNHARTTLAALAALSILGHAALAQCPPAPPPPPGGGGAGGSDVGGGGSPPGDGPNAPSPGAPSPGAPAPPAPGSPPSGSPPPADSPPSIPDARPAPNAPRSRGPAGPASPGGAPAASPTPSSGRPSGPASAVALGEDLLHWRHWWFLESAAYLDLRAHIQGPAAADGRSIVLSAPRAPGRRIVAAEVVPRLVALATTHRDDDVRASALLALGRVGDAGLALAPGTALDPAVVGALRSQLPARQHAVAEAAALGLGLLAEPALIDDLVQLARNTADGQLLVGRSSVPTRLRCFAAYGLALAAERSAAPEVRQRIALELVEALSADDPRVDELDVAFLSALGLCPLPERPVLPPAALRARPGIAAALSRTAQLEFLAAWVAPTRADGRKSDLVRAHACVAAARLATDAGTALRARTVATLARLAGDRSEGLDLRAAAALALGEAATLGDHPVDRAARRQLLELAADGQPLERRMALIGAARAGSRPGAGEDTLAGHAEVRRALRGELQRGHSFDRPWIALALGVQGEALHRVGAPSGEGAFEVLRTTSIERRGADDTGALALALALSARGTPLAAQASERVLDSVARTGDPDTLGHLFLAGALLGCDSLRPTLRSEVRGSVAQPVRFWSAAVALALLGEPVSAQLVPALQGARSSAAQVAIAAAIGHSTGSEAVLPLLSLIDEPRLPSATVAAAVDALGALCDLERLPWRHSLASGLPYFALTPTLVSGGVGVLELPW